MLKSRVIIIPIKRGYDEVYGFLRLPESLLVWGAANPDAKMEHVADNDYLVDLPLGPKIMRFSPRNDYGVLDFQVLPQGASSGPATPVRLHRNDDGCELVYIYFQRAGISDEQFASDAEWLQSDLLRMKAYVEGR